MTKQEAGRLGGLATLKKYGFDHYKNIGKMGARAFHRKYVLLPFGTNNFLIADREKGVVINSLYFIPDHNTIPRSI